MWKVVFKSRLGQEIPLRMKLVRVHMTAAGSPEFQKGKKMTEKVNRVKVATEFQSNKNMVDKEGISKLDQRPVSYQTQLPSYGFQAPVPGFGLDKRFSLPVEQSGQGTITKKTSLEGKPLELMEEFSKLEKEFGRLVAMEADHSEHEYGRKKMELSARLETLYNEAKSYEISGQFEWEYFLVSVSLLRLEFQRDKRPSFPWDKIPDYRGIFSKLNRLREGYPKVSQIQGNLADFWKSTSFPVEPEIFRRNDLLVEWVGLARRLVPLLKSAMREYPQDIEDEEVASIGKSFDVVELLSRYPGDLIRNDRDRSSVALDWDTFKGKHVLICCVHVPVLPVDNSEFPILVNLCHELHSTRDDLEMVVVARMSSLANDEEIFHHFFSGFPKSCLAVPFKDSKRRDYICKVLGLGLSSHDHFESLLLNAEGIVLASLPLVLSRYGAEGFPFTQDILHERNLEVEDIVFNKKGGDWLERVLRCNDTSPDSVYKFNPAGGPREEMSISQLSNKLKDKHVGLYWCSQGYMIPNLLAMCEKCKDKQLDFEIVVVYMPYAIRSDPQTLQEKIDRLLKKHNVRDWWCLPFNNSVSMRFFHLSYRFDDEETDFTNHDRDKLVVMGPGVDHLDIYGFEVMRYQGINAYPFTVLAGIKLVEDGLRQITLESLLVGGDVSVFRGTDSSDSVQLRQLVRGKKNIILFFGGGGGDYSKSLASVYKQTKAVRKDDFEMVFVGTPEDESVGNEMPWYICPINALDSTQLKELMRLLASYFKYVLVGFGEDGRVCSCPEICYAVHRTQHFSLSDTLYHDVEVMLGYDELLGHGMDHFNFSCF